VLILQDDAYGMIRWKQAADGHPDLGMTFGNPDFVAYAAAYGVKGSRVESADGLAPTLEAAFCRQRSTRLCSRRLFGEHAGIDRRVPGRSDAARGWLAGGWRGDRDAEMR
jgi:thiamine pyrophosphate-dependent acetolactate synthase large subunit-like protein